MSDEIRPIRIGLVGSAGLGKSTVASLAAAGLGVQFLRSKDITRPFLAAYGYAYGDGQPVERFLSRPDIEAEIVRERIDQESYCPEGFVTDRTTLECFAYAMLGMDQYDDESLAGLEALCRSHMQSYTGVFYFGPSGGWLEDNHLRTVSQFFQWKIDMIVRGLMADWGVEFTAVPDGIRHDARAMADFVVSRTRG